MSTKLLLLLATLVATSAVSHDDHADEDIHSHVDNDERTCMGHEYSYQMMENSEAYRQKHDAENANCDEHVASMREKKNHSLKKRKSIINIMDTDHDEDRRQLFSEYDDYIANEPVIVIPIVFHVLYSNDDENLSDEQLQSQISVLNEDFRAANEPILNGKVSGIWSDRVGDAKIEFYKNGTDRQSIGSSEMCNNETTVKLTEWGGLDGWNPKYYLNFWVCNMSGLLGYAEFPCLLDTVNQWKDGVVVQSSAVGSVEYDVNGTFNIPSSSNYDLGRTASHEIGHWLNLYHIWGDYDSCTNASYATDHVSDTPRSYTSNSGCPDNSTNTCNTSDPELGRDLRDMYENMMDYCYDACFYMFTEEQVWRMRAVLSGSGCRRELYYQGAILSGNETYEPSSQRTTSAPYACDDGCLISEDYINDAYCDCSECEDEQYFTCQTCSGPGGCPTSCGGYKSCGTNSTATTTTYSTTYSTSSSRNGTSNNSMSSNSSSGVSYESTYNSTYSGNGTGGGGIIDPVSGGLRYGGYDTYMFLVMILFLLSFVIVRD